jgi:hypothetical protein
MRAGLTTFGLALLFASTAALAADLPERRFVVEPVKRAVAACYPGGGVSALAQRGPASVIEPDVRALYTSALEVSRRDSTEASVTERITWAYASRTACGIALGMLSMGEVNGERLWNCECYYARMQATLGGRYR